MRVLFELPNWAQYLVISVAAGILVLVLLISIITLVKVSKAESTSETLTTKEIELLGNMSDKLSDTKSLNSTVQSVSGKVSDSLELFEMALTLQKESNANLASFIMECFNKSNLTDEAKAELHLIADKIFYGDNSALVEALKQAKLQAENAVAAGKDELQKVKEQLAERTKQLARVQENTKSNRRI